MNRRHLMLTTGFGMLAAAIGHLPETGEEISIGRFDFRIARADARRVHALHVIVRGDA